MMEISFKEDSTFGAYKYLKGWYDEAMKQKFTSLLQSKSELLEEVKNRIKKVGLKEAHERTKVAKSSLIRITDYGHEPKLETLIDLYEKLEDER